MTRVNDPETAAAIVELLRRAERAEDLLQHYKDRERDICAAVGGVSDGGQYRADIIGKLQQVYERSEKAKALEEQLAASERERKELVGVSIRADKRIAQLETRFDDQVRLHAEAIRGCHDNATFLAAERRQAEEQAELERARADLAESRLAAVVAQVDECIDACGCMTGTFCESFGCGTLRRLRGVATGTSPAS